MAVFIDLPNIYCDRRNYGEMAILAVIEHISEGTLFFRTLIFNQFPYLNMEIPTQFTNQSSIKSTNTITAVFIEVGSGEYQGLYKSCSY